MSSRPQRRRNNNKRQRLSNNSILSNKDVRLTRSILQPHNGSDATTTINRRLNYAGTVSSQGGGIINAIIGLAPNNFTNWTALAALYDEFRVVGAEIRISPVTNLNSTSANAMCVLAYDNDDSSNNIPSLVAGLDYTNKTLFNAVWTTQDVIKFSAVCYSLGDKSTGTEWFTSATPGSIVKSFKFYGTGLTASTSYFTVACSLAVQFRGPL